MKKNILHITLILLLTITSSLFSQSKFNDDDEGKVYYTYAGANLGGLYSYATYSDWFTDKRETKTQSGIVVPGGLMLNIFIDQFSGEFTAEVIYDLSASIFYTKFTSSGKYILNINNELFFGAGLGIYLETPPSSATYNGGAGVLLPLEIGYKLTDKSRITMDIITSYGSYGMGEDNYQILSGVRFAFLYRVGAL